MERPYKCPTCLSAFPDIRGVIFDGENGHDSRQCSDPWHRKDYNADVLTLTREDRALLAGMKIGV